METIPQHTVCLQDGTLCNFRKRLLRKTTSLLTCFHTVADPRKKRGIRHELPLFLFILFAGMTTGSTTLKDCRLWAIHNKKFLRKFFLLKHGVPDATTISDLLQKVRPEEIVDAYLCFLKMLGITLGDVFSADGKTMRGVTGKDAIRHIFSIFSHALHAVLTQSGVTQKENEIPVLRNLLTLEEVRRDIKGALFLADALHANAESAQAILDANADYILVIKGNQKDFFDDIYTVFSGQEDIPGTNYQTLRKGWDTITVTEKKRKRDITTTYTLTHDRELCSYLKQQHAFPQLQTIGMLRRKGIRITKDGTESPVDETVCFVSSRSVSALEISTLLRNHWCIENNLHWVKDFIFLEDRQTLRLGNAPQNMSFLRSMCISIFNIVKFASISDALHNFAKSKELHYQFLKKAAIV